ncbi:hypothetical protein ACFQI7_13085 [Paenibacillus allorhizosphaerae]|uniref:Uncharacterized protein n=1 Tax=Paenibacillus allorhizosphaerae TaxID=2849866 RepID=A0ABM8VL66_9BACL|nr:hypothetical protein [Paenibacillus allorhizosphaerae]CAG7648097.1 hypothetical protein PAECIP111802_04122 [Paenibacillus allorhizosphaerae]
MAIFFSKAFITPKGIYFKSSYYSCKVAIRKQWFHPANRQINKLVWVAYFKNDKRYILILKKHKAFLASELNNPINVSEEVRHAYFEEINRLKKIRKVEKKRRIQPFRKKRYRSE